MQKQPRDKRTLRQLENELRRRQREDPLSTVYSPSNFQLEVHKSRAPITCVFGGNRIGKTYVAVAEAILYCLGRSTYSETPEPPVNVWYVLPTSGQFERNIEPIWRLLCPDDVVQKELQRPRMFRFKNGSTLHFMSADMRQRRLAGASVDLVICDEPLHKSVFVELQARTIDRKGRMLMVMTPVDDKPDNWIWVRDDLYIPWEIGERKDIDVIYAPVADAEGNSLVPHFNNDDIKRMQQQWPDPQVRAARMYGHFVMQSGLIFHQFDPKVHEIPAFTFPDSWHKWIVVDPQYHRFAALFYVADEDGTYYIYDEYFSQDEPLATRAMRMKEKLGEHDGPVVPVYVDSANPQDIAELNWHFNRIGARMGAVSLPMKKRVEQMILKVQSMMEPDEKRKYHLRTSRRNVYGAPRLLLFDTLESTWKGASARVVKASRLKWELRRLVWGNNYKPNKTSAGGADMIDALAYGCSILAVGRSPNDQPDQYAEMEPFDANIHRAMDRMNKEDEREERWRHIR